MSTGPREETLFSEALVLPVAERAAFLADACARDPALRARVEALLAAAAESRCVLDTSAAPRPAVVIEEKPGDVIGRYKLLQQIGEGGCGVVYMAEQKEPVVRRVALKVIKLGMDTKAVVARFEAERQALALMDHPNIAKVLDGGATDTGRPYFVMELVRGIPITRFCDDRNLSAAERLSLFVQVCQAIQHAHQKGIIHRDIKPSNVLVTLHDDKAVPVVIDFGIAKATTGRLTDRTLFTSFDQFMGTPVYMAPEQADYNALDVDTRSDIYSLGVLLYELLTGRPPFDPKTLTNVAVAQMRHVICEVEPPPPSVRLRTLDAEERTTIARLRGTVPQRLSLILRGDLDWIVMKAMEKNRTRRYESAAALAADITRHLNHEPVIARPPSTAYRLLKFTRRHRFGVAAAAAVMTVLVGGIIASTWQAVRATQAEHRAEAEASKAVQSRTRAEDLLGFMLIDLRLQLEKLERLDLLESVAEKALAYVASFDASDIDDTTLGNKVKALTVLGAVRVSQMRYPEAMKSLVQAHALAVPIVNRHPRDSGALFDRAQAEYWIGYVHWRHSEQSEAADWFLRYRESSNALTALDAANPRFQREAIAAYHNLAALELEQGNLSAARDGFVRGLEALERISTLNPKNLEFKGSIANTVSFLGTVAERSGNLVEAVAHFDRQARLLEELTRIEPRTRQWQERLASAHALAASVLAITGEPKAALRRRAEARLLLRPLIAADPSNRTLQRMELKSRLQTAMLQRATEVGASWQATLAEARRDLAALAQVAASDRKVAGLFAVGWRLEAEMRSSKDDPEAAAAVEQALLLSEPLLSNKAADDETTGDYLAACLVAGNIAHRNGRTDLAVRHWHRVLEVAEARLNRSANWRLLDPAARALAQLGRAEEHRAIVERLRGFGYQPLEPWPRE